MPHLYYDALILLTENITIHSSYSLYKTMSDTSRYRVLLGNEAIARAIIESGCTVSTSYPGTPASEILESIARFRDEENLKIHVEWSPRFAIRLPEAR